MPENIKNLAVDNSDEPYKERRSQIFGFVEKYINGLQFDEQLKEIREGVNNLIEIRDSKILSSEQVSYLRNIFKEEYYKVNHVYHDSLILGFSGNQEDLDKIRRDIAQSITAKILGFELNPELKQKEQKFIKTWQLEAKQDENTIKNDVTSNQASQILLLKEKTWDLDIDYPDYDQARFPEVDLGPTHNEPQFKDLHFLPAETNPIQNIVKEESSTIDFVPLDSSKKKLNYKEIDGPMMRDIFLRDPYADHFLNCIDGKFYYESGHLFLMSNCYAENGLGYNKFTHCTDREHSLEREIAGKKLWENMNIEERFSEFLQALNNDVKTNIKPLAEDTEIIQYMVNKAMDKSDKFSAFYDMASYCLGVRTLGNGRWEEMKDFGKNISKDLKILDLKNMDISDSIYLKNSRYIINDMSTDALPKISIKSHLERTKNNSL